MKGRDKLGQLPRPKGPGSSPTKLLPGPAQGTGQGWAGTVPTEAQAPCPGRRGCVSSHSDLGVPNAPAGLPFCWEAPHTPSFLPPSRASPRHRETGRSPERDFVTEEAKQK